MNTIEAEKKSIEKIVTLALTKANAMSRRAGIGWAAIDKEGNLILCDATIAGLETARLAHRVERNSEKLDHLIMTLEPAQGVYRTGDLINSIENSHCSTITIAHQLTNGLADPIWRNWCTQWRGKINYLKETHAASSLALGVQNTKAKQRPWVTAICAANVSGMSLPLSQLADEFGFKDYIANHVMQSRALMYSTDQTEVIAHIPGFNALEEPLEPYEIYNKDSIRTLLNYFAKEMRCSVTVLCDLNTISHLIEHDLVDEIAYHIAGFDKNDAINQDVNRNALSKSSINLSGWQLLSCSPVGGCCRMVLCKHDNADIEMPDYLQLGLN